MRGQTFAAGAFEAPPAPPTLADTTAKLQVEKIIELQKDEIRRLREQLEATASRPQSMGRLPALTTSDALY